MTIIFRKYSKICLQLYAVLINKYENKNKILQITANQKNFIFLQISYQ